MAVGHSQAQLLLALIRHSELNREVQSATEHVHIIPPTMDALRVVSRIWVRDLYALPGSAARTDPGRSRFLHHHLHYKYLLLRRPNLRDEAAALAALGLEHSYSRAVGFLHSVAHLNVKSVGVATASLKAIHQLHVSPGRKERLTDG